MTWEVRYTEEAKKDFAALDGSQKILVKKAIEKVQQNPLPNTEGGYGKPLSNYNNSKTVQARICNIRFFSSRYINFRNDF